MTRSYAGYAAAAMFARKILLQTKDVTINPLAQTLTKGEFHPMSQGINISRRRN